MRLRANTIVPEITYNVPIGMLNHAQLNACVCDVCLTGSHTLRSVANTMLRVI